MTRYFFLPALVFIGVALSLPLPVQYIVAACLLMVMGLPHGAFDIALEHQARREAQVRPVATVKMIALYVAIAGVMAAAWLITPIGALLLFFLLAIEHFSEELRRGLDPWIARASATAFLTAPLVLHRPEVDRLFSVILASNTGEYVSDILLLVAPVAIVVAISGVAILIAESYYREAAKISIVIAMMLLISPIIAFTAYFCFDHAPRYLKKIDDRLALSTSPRAMRQAACFTVASLMAAVMLALMLHGSVLSEASIKAAFIILSVLTLPHITMPAVLDWMTRRPAMIGRSSTLAARV